jgi:multimeric flavodoxin WrbA
MINSKIKVIGLAGSPRRGGNTDSLLAEMLRGAESAGAETKTIVLSDLNITPCRHCDACLKDGCCVVQDDMQMIYNELGSADRIILASPVQFMGPTAHVKGMIDRCQSLWARKYMLKVPPLNPVKERKGFFISTGGRKFKDLFRPSLVIVKSFFLVLNVTYAGDLLFSGIDEKGAIQKYPDALQQAFEAGKAFVSR